MMGAERNQSVVDVLSQVFTLLIPGPLAFPPAVHSPAEARPPGFACDYCRPCRPLRIEAGAGQLTERLQDSSDPDTGEEEEAASSTHQSR